MGLFCKGLHCAGCGKGVPAGIVVLVVLVMATRGMGHALDSVASGLIDAIYWLIGAVILSAVVIPIALRWAFRRPGQCAVRWDNSMTITEQKQGELYVPEPLPAIARPLLEWPNIEVEREAIYGTRHMDVTAPD